MKRLLELRPKDLDSPDKDGNTPLHLATLQGNLGVVKLLLESGCECNHQNVFGDPPLITATADRYLELMVVLLIKGADARTTNINGQSALDLIDQGRKNDSKIQIPQRLRHLMLNSPLYRYL